MRVIDLAPALAVVVDIVAWALIHAATGYLVHRLDRRHFAHDTVLTRARGWERDGAFYERWLRIKRWKGWLPEAGALFADGFDKRALGATDSEYLRRYLEETRRAEWGHVLAAAFAPLFFLWNPWPVGLVMIGYALAANVPCVWSQRYNRLRLTRILRKRGDSRPGSRSSGWGWCAAGQPGVPFRAAARPGRLVGGTCAMSPEGQNVLGAKLRIPRVKAMARERVGALLAPVWDHRLALVVAAAGSGKTTLVSQFAADSGVPVAWYRAEPADSSAAAAVAHLERALTSALGIPGDWTTVDDVIERLDQWAGERALIVVDDLHALWGTEAEATLERLLDNLRPGIVMVAATRRLPGFNLSRLRVSGELVELGPDELRFRSWEVERLFLDFYGEPLRPDELAELARRTEGWAAGLQLFHLATRGKPAGDRRRMLSELGVRSRLMREYLARNVLDELPLHVRDFLMQTCVLGRLTPALCDELRGATSSEQLLAELEQRQIFTTPLDDEGSYRYHEVLRSHLEAVLVESVGEIEARRRYREAGALLEAHGDLPEALRAYCRAEDWEAATNLLGGRGEQVIDRPGDWIDGLPATLLDHDPWLLLASARRSAAAGQWQLAIESYVRAEAISGPGEPQSTARRERQAVESWFAPPVVTPSDWMGVVRLAASRDPAGVARRESTRLDGAAGDLATGVAFLLDGDVVSAEHRLEELRRHPDASPTLALGARAGAALASALSGGAVEADVVGLAEEAEATGVPWLAGFAGLVSSLAGTGNGSALESVVAKDDAWGLPLAQLCAGLGYLRAGDGRATELLEDAALGFASVDAAVLSAWAASGAALARSLWADADGRAGVLAGAKKSLSAARASKAHGPLMLAALAMAVADPTHSAAHLRLAESAGHDVGLEPEAFRPAVHDDAWPEPIRSEATPISSLTVQCLGPLEASLDGQPLTLTDIKPRVRSLFRALALHAGQPLHRDRLIDWLWPGEGDVKVGTRNLQVAVSSLRQMLEPGVARGAATVVVREGDTYQLRIGAEACDVLAFEREVAAGRELLATGADVAGGLDLLSTALDRYRGEVLADEGAAEWVMPERDRIRLLAAETSLARARALIDEGRPAEASLEAERGLRIDQYNDGLWRLLVDASEQAGDRAAARRHQDRYQAMLRDLGV